MKIKSIDHTELGMCSEHKRGIIMTGEIQPWNYKIRFCLMSLGKKYCKYCICRKPRK